MSKSLRGFLCLLLIAPGCGHSTLPKASQERLAYAEKVDEERYLEEHPDVGAGDDDVDTVSGEAIVGAAALTAGAIVYPFYYIANQIDLARGNTPAKAAREMNDPHNLPDIQREGMARLVTQWTFTHRTPYTTRYAQIAQQDPNDTVRAMAIRALNISRDRTATPIFIAALEDGSELVRLEAVKALGNIPDPAAVPALIRRLQGKRDMMFNGQPDTIDESKDVRIAAADALRRYRTLDVARVLTSQLGQHDFSIAWQANNSLVLLTKHDFGYDEYAWLQYLTGPEKPFG